MAAKQCISFARRLLLISTFFANYVPASTLMVQDLGGSWTVENSLKGYSFPAVVPGGIYSDLMRSNIIGDVFYEFNDENTRWVSETTWNYSRCFTADKILLDHETINLVFNGVDTYAKILINGVEVGYTENMFQRYIFDVKPHLQLGNNEILLEFESPVVVAKKLFDYQAKDHVVPPICVPDYYNGECHANHIRKMQASFAWDWGPAFPSVGIWKSVYLEAYNSSVIRDLTVNIVSNTKTNHWEIQLNTYLAENVPDGSVQGTLKIEVSTEIQKITEIYKITVRKNQDGDYLVTNKLSVPKSYVKLWWPNGYGEAKLYTMQVSFINSNKTEKSTKRIKIGFRTVELVQDVIEKGRAFYFKINSVPIFAKGANSIPVSILPELGQNETTVKFLLQSAKDVHMNMLRVWGGGVYESDKYYEIADALGILIWQDFMFACSMYPANQKFLELVEGEVKHQARRLQHHPSIVLWAGNNENEAALRQNWYNTHSNFSLYQSDYKKLYVETIKKELLLNDDTRPFLTSSPTNGLESDKEDYVAENPQSHHYGDVHFYNYIMDGWQTSVYPISRFASEYGYQSMPNVDTWLTATNHTDNLKLNSKFLNSRQHHVGGYIEMEALIGYQLKLPNSNSSNYFKAFVFYSQIIQAMSIKIETEYYRTWRSATNDAGEGLTMGALYWQLNDVWVAPSWASIDFKNNWKMVHYFAKRFFAPVIVTGNLATADAETLKIYVVSDLMRPIYNATVTISVYRWDSFTPVRQEPINTDVLPGVSHNIKTYTLNKLLAHEEKPCGPDKKNCLICMTLKNSKNKSIAPDNYVFPIKLKLANLQVQIMQISNVTQIDTAAKQFEIDIKCNKIALFVWLDAKRIQGRFSDNGFLQVTSTKTIRFNANQPTTVTELKRSLSVTNLMDGYLHVEQPLH